jgi:phytoene synthase
VSGRAADLSLVARSAATIASGSKSFAAAARLFDLETRDSAMLLYAWCRHCDDMIDGQSLGHVQIGGGGASREALDHLHAQTRAVFRGAEPEDPAFAALAEVIRRHDLPEAFALAHLAGYAMDVEGRVYRTLADTLEYCYGVAGVVGLMMARVMGVRRPEILDRACDLGIAFQLTNIARDVIEDAADGRVYLPREWLAQAGITAGEIALREHRAALAGVVARLLAAAEPYYASAAIGIADLPPRSAWAIAAAHRVYRAIGTEVARRGPDAWNARVVTTGASKLAALLGGGADALAAPVRRRLRAPPPRDGLWTRPPSPTL